jgi:4-amino-4-deoxy-L-arabinose transferase-like glycosyltransferase
VAAMPPHAAAGRAIAPRTVRAVAVLLACYLALGLSAACRKSQTGDEGLHLAGGVSFWATGDYRLQPASGNWPQHWCALPVWLAGYQFPSLETPAWRELSEWDFAELFCYAIGNNVDQMLLVGRLMAAVFAVALAIVVYAWSRALFGPRAGLLSLTLFAFSPTMLTHGFLILADMPAALFFTVAVAALWRLLHRVSPATLLVTWFALSGLFLSKFTGPIIVPVGLVLVGVRMLNPAPVVVAFGRIREVRGRVAQGGLFAGLLPILVLGVALSIWGSFGFRYSLLNPALGPPAREVPWDHVKNQSPTVNAAFDFAREHRLLPEAYLYGFCHSLHTAEERSAFLNGEFRQRGWIGFFPYCLVTKTPLELFVVLALAVAALVYYRGRVGTNEENSDDQSCGTFYHLAPLLVLFGVYWVFALTSHLNIGHRHLLPTYPPMMIVAGAAAWWLKPPGDRPRPAGSLSTAPAQGRPARGMLMAARVVVVCALLALIAESLWFWPDYLAYFNLIVGGPRYGYRHLGDSSLDWSQDLKELKRWLDGHPGDARDPRRLYFAFYGGPPPEYYGIHAQRLPSFPDRWRPHVPDRLTGGTYVISATMLQCFMLSPPGRWNRGYEESYQQVRQDVETFLRLKDAPGGKEQLLEIAPVDAWSKLFDLYERLRFSRLASFLRAREPDDQVGYSILVYRLSDADIAQALDGLPAEELAEPEWQTENRRLGLDTPGG